jgi:uncharacterized protein YkwD
MNYGLADRLVQMINNERARLGVSDVTQNAALTTAARDYAALHFLSTDPFQLNHYLDGGPGDRAKRNGYAGLVAEALVTGSPQAEQLMQAWLNSPPHRDIILDSQYRDIGVGCYEGSYVDASGSTLHLALCVANLGQS